MRCSLRIYTEDPNGTDGGDWTVHWVAVDVGGSTPVDIAQVSVLFGESGRPTDTDVVVEVVYAASVGAAVSATGGGSIETSPALAADPVAVSGVGMALPLADPSWPQPATSAALEAWSRVTPSTDQRGDVALVSADTLEGLALVWNATSNVMAG